MIKYKADINAAHTSVQEYLTTLLDIVQEALFSECDVSACEAYRTLRELSDDKDAAQLWNVHLCPEGQISLDFIHHTPHNYTLNRVHLGNVHRKYLPQVKGERELFVGRA